MAISGGDLGMRIRGFTLAQIITYRECVFRDVLPAFGNPEERARRVAEEYFSRKTNEPAGENEDGSIERIAEDTVATGVAFYEGLISAQQTMKNLLAAGLFHLVEQQLAELCRDGASAVPPPAETNLGKVAAWYLEHFLLDLKSLGNWKIVDELRLVANTVKHAEISQTTRLRALRPELFQNPAYTELDQGLLVSGALELPVREPLAGSDLFVSGPLLKTYSQAAESLFVEIAKHFEARDDEYYPR